MALEQSCRGYFAPVVYEPNLIVAMSKAFGSIRDARVHRLWTDVILHLRAFNQRTDNEIWQHFSAIKASLR